MAQANGSEAVLGKEGMMDLNMVVLEGRLAADPEHMILDSGRTLIRLLIAIRSEASHSRLDVVPVIWWEPDDQFVASPPKARERVWMSGSVQRRFWDAPDGRHSKLEVIAGHVAVLDANTVSDMTAHNGP